MSNITIAFFATIASIASSLIGSFSGGGSSFVLFPLLLMFIPATYASVLTLAKVSALAMSVVSGNIHFKRHKIHWNLFAVLTISGLLGTAIGTYLVQYHLNQTLFLHILGVILICLSGYLFFSKELGVSSSRHEKIPNASLVLIAVFSFFINILNGLFGGIGIIVSTFLIILLKINFIEAVVYSMSSFIVVNAFQTTYLLFSEKTTPLFIIAIIIGSSIGAYIGTKLQYLKGNLWIKRASILVMLIIGIKSIFS